jgi:ribose transport system permease protein
MSKDVRDLSRRRMLLGGVAVGSAALLAACTSNEQTPTNTQTKGPEGGANPNSAAGKAITIGFSAPAADHGWIAAITNNAKAQAAMANLYELDAIAAAIIGGTLLSGGRGTIIGALFGVLVFSTITNLFAINNLSTEVQNMVKGGIIVAAVLVQQFRYRSLTQLFGRKTA